MCKGWKRILAWLAVGLMVFCLVSPLPGIAFGDFDSDSDWSDSDSGWSGGSWAASKSPGGPPFCAAP